MNIFNKIVKEKNIFLSIKFVFGIRVKVLINLGLDGMNKDYQTNTLTIMKIDG